MTFTDEQWKIGIGLLDDRADEARLRANVTQAGPAVTAQLMRHGVTPER